MGAALGYLAGFVFLGIAVVMDIFYWPGMLGEAFITVVVAIILTVASFFVVRYILIIVSPYRERRCQNWAALIALFAFLWVMLPHIYMSRKLIPIKREFNVKADGPSKESVEYGWDGPVTVLSYEGELDIVINKRDAFLRRHGFVKFGSWHVGSNGKSFMTTYLYMPLLAR